MNFKNLELNDLRNELFLWQIIGWALPKKFILSTDENDLKVVFCQIDLCPIEYFLALQLEISRLS